MAKSPRRSPRRHLQEGAPYEKHKHTLSEEPENNSAAKHRKKKQNAPPTARSVAQGTTQRSDASTYSSNTQATVTKAMEETTISNRDPAPNEGRDDSNTTPPHTNDVVDQGEDVASIPSNHQLESVNWPSIQASVNLQRTKKGANVNSDTNDPPLPPVIVKPTHRVSPEARTQRVVSPAVAAANKPMQPTIEYLLQRPPKPQTLTTTTTNTTENQTSSNSANVNAGEEQGNSDDTSVADTIASGQTLRPGEDLEESNNSNLNTARYSLTILIPKIDVGKKKKELNVDELPSEMVDPDKRLQQFYVSWFKKAQSFDPALQLFAWSKDNDAVIKNSGEIPSDPATLKKFFFGASAKEEGRVFAQVRIYTKLQSDAIVNNMQSWLTKHQGRLQRCIIQSEYSVTIGWLVYSSTFTDIHHLKKEMEKRTSFEWGFKIGQVTSSDAVDDEGKKRAWKDRMKAINVVVSNRYRDEAIQKAKEIFSSNIDNLALKPTFAQKYIFLETESALQDMPNCTENYLILRGRHEVFSKRLLGCVSTSIYANIDKVIHTPNHGDLTLRQMIMSIPSTTTKSANGFSLFQNLDATADGSSVFFKNRRGPKGPGFIFSYLQVFQAEAKLMIRGLPVYLAHVYGTAAVRTKFTPSTWESVAGWQWDPKENSFLTPDMKQVEHLVTHDPMAGLLELENVEQHPEDDKEKENDDQAEKELLRKFNDTDADSVRSLSKKAHDVATVQVPASTADDLATEEHSTTSSVTFEEEDVEMASDHSEATQQATGKTTTPNDNDGGSLQSSNTQATLNTTPTFMNQKKLDKAWDPRLSKKDNLRNRKKLIKHSYNKFHAEMQRQLEACDNAEVEDEDDDEEMEDGSQPPPQAMNIVPQRSKHERERAKASTMTAENTSEQHQDEKEKETIQCTGVTQSAPAVQTNLPPVLEQIDTSFLPINSEDDYSADVCEEIEKFTSEVLAQAYTIEVDPNSTCSYKTFMEVFQPEKPIWNDALKCKYRAMVNKSPLAHTFMYHFTGMYDGRSWLVDEENAGNAYTQYRAIHPTPQNYPLEYPNETYDQFKQRAVSDRPPNDAPAGGDKAGEEP